MEHLEPEPVAGQEPENIEIFMPHDAGESRPETPVLGSGPEVPQGPFEVTTVLDLPAMSLDKLAVIEAQLAAEFHSLSKEYVDARAVRTKYLLDSIDLLIAAAENQDREWSTVYGQKTKNLEKVIAAPENHLLGLRQEKYNDETLRALIALIVAPQDLDDIATRNEKLPFAQHFKKISAPYETQLQALRNHYDYQNALIDNNVKRNQEIIWEQYLQAMLDRRNDLIDKTYHELAQLYEEFHGIREERTAVLDWNHYYRSVVPVSEIANSQPHLQLRLKRGNIDSYYDIDNRYFKKNKIQLTKAKMDALDRARTFEAKQRGHSIPQQEKVTVKLTTCSGLTQDEVDADLETFRSSRLHDKDGKHQSEAPSKAVSELQAAPLPNIESITPLQS